MDLSINNWPATTSHSIAIIIGMLLSNLLTPSKAKPRFTQTNRVIVVLKQNSIIRQYENKTRVSDLVAFLMPLKKGEFCHLESIVGKVTQIKPHPAIELSKTESMYQISKLLKENKLSIAPMSYIAGFKKCKSGPRVSFGSKYL